MVELSGTDGGVLVEVDLISGARTTLHTDTQGAFGSALAVHDANVYWSNGVAETGRVIKVPRDGAAPVIVASYQQLPRGIAVDDQAIYWVTIGGSASGFGTFMKVAK